ncbi:MAG: nucleotidyltransferase family protein [Candidatus Taylorbacteria bacterium]|nr:nucleotidyltransferase family protein [Candidatus Taylorbacteria bacterium]
MSTQAVILCAGLGTRLRPYTDTVPKVMIPILGKPLLLWHIEQFKKHGVHSFCINTHYLPKVITDYFGDGSKWDVRITYSFEQKPLGTAGGLKGFEGKLDEEFFLVYGDTFSLVDYSKMREAWEKLPRTTLGMQRMKETREYADADVAEVGADGRFLAIHPKPHTREYSHVYRMRGVFILRKTILSHIPPNVPYEIGKHLLPDIVSKGLPFFAYECDDYSKGIDTIEKWREVEAYLREHGLSEGVHIKTN